MSVDVPLRAARPAGVELDQADAGREPLERAAEDRDRPFGGGVAERRRREVDEPGPPRARPRDRESSDRSGERNRGLHGDAIVGVCGALRAVGQRHPMLTVATTQDGLVQPGSTSSTSRSLGIAAASSGSKPASAIARRALAGRSARSAARRMKSTRIASSISIAGSNVKYRDWRAVPRRRGGAGRGPPAACRSRTRGGCASPPGRSRRSCGRAARRAGSRRPTASRAGRSRRRPGRSGRSAAAA